MTKMYWACYMTVHCDLTMQLCNTSDQCEKRSIVLNYYVLAWCSSTKHSTQQSALTLKYWQNTSYHLGGINRLYAVMTISAHWFSICSHISEGVRRLPPPWLRAKQQWLIAIWQGWETCGSGTNTDRVNMAFLSPKIELKSQQNETSW